MTFSVWIRKHYYLHTKSFHKRKKFKRMEKIKDFSLEAFNHSHVILVQDIFGTILVSISLNVNSNSLGNVRIFKDQKE